MQILGIEILGSQLILSIIIGFILIKTWISFWNKQISASFSIFWAAFWCSTLFIVYYPGLLVGIANTLGVGRGVDLAIYLSVVTLFYIVFKLSVSIQSLERQITKLTREISIKNEK